MVRRQMFPVLEKSSSIRREIVIHARQRQAASTTHEICFACGKTGWSFWQKHDRPLSNHDLGKTVQSNTFLPPYISVKLGHSAHLLKFRDQRQNVHKLDQAEAVL
uniref:Uncharacterized protein n=1 Tax=Spongospora subterranea TaxID=70186 RepID=A0A0H5QS74_9EUKA|eukprot:CRZ04868.1 hypothetical protein [Spongospora subterranea]